MPNGGWIIACGPCRVCGREIRFNPLRVPAIEDHPVCQECIDGINDARAGAGLEPIEVAADAYEPCHADDLDW